MKDKISVGKITICALCGIFVGFFNGFFGGGGGMIVVPLLIFALGLQEKEAHATAILTILPISLVSAIVYIVKGNVDYSSLGLTTIGFILGGVVGAFLLKKLNNKVIRIIFSLLMIVAGIKIIW